MKTLQQRAFVVPLTSAVLLNLIVALMFAQAVSADEFMNISDIDDCRKIKANAERLLCYDTVIDGGIFNEQKLRQVQVESFGSEKMPKTTEAKPVVEAPVAADSKTGVETSVAAGSKTATESKAVADTKPAPETKAVADTKLAPETKANTYTGKDASVDRITVTVVRMQKDRAGVHYFQTSDGQVWKQQSASKWNTKAPFDAEIKAAMLGSFFLVNEGGQSTRIKRVK
jgi:hypothetical protein